MNCFYSKRLLCNVWICLIATLLVFFIRDLTIILAAEAPTSVYQTTPPKRQQIITENSYFFTVRSYDPPAKIAPIRQKTESSYQTPEEAVISLLSAMFRKDHQG